MVFFFGDWGKGAAVGGWVSRDVVGSILGAHSLFGRLQLLSVLGVALLLSCYVF